MIRRTYSELMRIDSYDERYDYLQIKGAVGRESFGFDRHINQDFYTSKEWRDIRHFVIARDLGCDMGVPGYEIFDPPLVHHMNPMTVADLTYGSPDILDPEYLITVSHKTHNAIHFGDKTQIQQQYVPRRPGDTTLWNRS